MEEKEFLLYLEQALKELGYNEAARFNIEGALLKTLKNYSLDEIKEKVEKTSFPFK